MNWTILAIAGVAVALLAVGALIAWAVRHERRGWAAVAAKWRECARELGGEFREASGPWYRRQAFRLLVPEAGGEIAVDSYEDARRGSVVDFVLESVGAGSGEPVTMYTRATTRVSSPHSLGIHREHALSGLGRKLGMQDLEVGDPEYDRTFVVKADDEAWLRERLSADLRELHLGSPDVAIALKKGELTAVQEGVLDETEGLRALLELTAAARRAFG